MDKVAAALNSGLTATRGRYRTRVKAAPRAQTKVWTQNSDPERRAQKTLYFGDETARPRTVSLHSCKLHCPNPTRTRWSRLLRPAVI